MEDLGTGPSLADFHLGRDPAAAEAAVMPPAAAPGQALRPTLHHGTPEEPDGLRAGLDEMRRLASALDVPVPAGVDADVGSIASMLARPGPLEAAFLAALGPTDPAGFVDVVAPAAVHYTPLSFRWFRRFVLDDRPLPARAPSTGRQ